jgi:RNA recognition motif-containing protein
MSANNVDSVTAQMATTSLDNNAPANANTTTTTESTGAQQPTAADDEAVRASAAEGRRLYIGNLAYATTEGELKDFFKDYLVYVDPCFSTMTHQVPS